MNADYETYARRLGHGQIIVGWNATVNGVLYGNRVNLYNESQQVIGQYLTEMETEANATLAELESRS